MLRLPVLPVIRSPAHSKVAAVAYTIVRIHEENELSTVTTVDIVVPLAVIVDGVNTTAVENEARISSTAVNKYFFHSNNFDGTGGLNFCGDPIILSTTLSRSSGIALFLFQSSVFAINHHMEFH